MNQEKRRERLWEYTWKQDTLEGFDPWVRTFRIVGWYWPDDDGVERLQTLHYEELSTDAMGEMTWNDAEDEVGICRPVIAKLLQLAGLIPADADLGSL